LIWYNRHHCPLVCLVYGVGSLRTSRADVVLAIGIFVFDALYAVNQSQQTELSVQSEKSSLQKDGFGETSRHVVMCKYYEEMKALIFDL